MNYDQEFADCLIKIQQESEILRKLLFRNGNQHKNTSVFQFCAQISRNLKRDIPNAKLEVLNNCLKQCLKYTIDSKISAVELEKFLAALSLSHLVVDTLSRTLHLCLKACRSLQILLAKRTFAGYYGLLVGLLSHLYCLLFQVFDRLYLDYQSLEDLLQHYAIVYPKFAKKIAAQLDAHRLSLETQEFYQKGKRSFRDEDRVDSKDNFNDTEVLIHSTESVVPERSEELQQTEIPEAESQTTTFQVIAAPTALDTPVQTHSSSITMYQSIPAKESTAAQNDSDEDDLPPLASALSSRDMSHCSRLAAPDQTANSVSNPVIQMKKKRKLESTKDENPSDQRCSQTVKKIKKKKTSSLTKSAKRTLAEEDQTEDADDIDKIFAGMF